MPLSRIIGTVVFLSVVLPVASGEAGPPGESEEKPRVEEHVEVRAARPVAEDVAAFATRIDAGEVVERAVDLADLLRRVPGARVRDYGGLGSYSTLSLRASTAEQVTVLVDGVPQNRALGGAVDLASIPATQVDRVSVYRGFAPAAYGLGGIGGVVDVRTRAPAEGFEAQVDALAGELKTRRLSSGLSLRTGRRGRLRIGVEALRSDGDFYYLDTGETPFDPSDDEERRRENNDVANDSLVLQQVWNDLASGSLRLGARVQRRDHGLPGLGSFSSQTARLDEDLQSLDLGWNRPGEGAIEDWQLLADAFRQTVRLRDPAGDIGLRVQDQTVRLGGAGVAAILRPTIGKHRITSRIDLRAESATVRDARLPVADRGGAERLSFSWTTEELYTVGRTTLAPSLRFEARRDEFVEGDQPGGLPPPEDLSENEFSGKFGVAHALGAVASLRGSIGSFYRPPSLLELFGDRGVVAGNPNLRSERGITAELGWARRQPKGALAWGGEVVGFARRTRDLIHLFPVSQGTAVARNVAEVVAYGIESGLSFRLSRGFALDGSLTLQEARDASGGFADGKPLPYQPGVLGWLGANWSRRGLRLGWEASYTGENSTDALDTPELRMPARVIHDASLSYRFRGGLVAGLDVRNVFDRQVRDLMRYPLPGRVVSAHLGWRTGERSP